MNNNISKNNEYKQLIANPERKSHSIPLSEKPATPEATAYGHRGVKYAGDNCTSYMQQNTNTSDSERDKYMEAMSNPQTQYATAPLLSDEPATLGATAYGHRDVKSAGDACTSYMQHNTNTSDSERDKYMQAIANPQTQYATAPPLSGEHATLMATPYGYRGAGIVDPDFFNLMFYPAEAPPSYDASEAAHRQDQTSDNSLNEYNNHLKPPKDLKKLSNPTPQQKFNDLLLNYINTKDYAKLQKLLTENASCSNPCSINEPVNDLDNTALIVAIKNQDNESAKILIDNKGINLNKKNKARITAVMVAMNIGNYEILAKLLEYPEVNSSLSAPNGTSILSYAFISIQDEGQILDLLLKYINPENEGLETFFASAVKNMIDRRHIRAAKVLINKFPSYLHKQDNDGNTAFTVTLQKGNYELAELIIKNTPQDQQDVVLNTQNHKSGHTPLMDLIFHSYNDIAKLLIDHGADLNTKNNKNNNDTALMYAIDNKNNEIATTLIKSDKCNVNQQNNIGETALVKAVYTGNLEIVQQLIQARADLNIQDEYGLTALMHATKNKKSEIATTLIKSDRCNVSLQSNVGETALMIAIFNRNIEIAQQLIQAGADLNLQNKNGSTALNFAAANGLYDIVKLLLKKDVALNTQHKSGLTPLMDATCRGYHDIVKLLIDHGADVNIQNLKADDYSALMYAVKHNKNEIATILIKSDICNVSQQSNVGETALMIAIFNRNIEIAQQLIQAGADLNLQNKNGSTALNFAAANGLYDIVKLLLKKDVALNTQHKSGLTPLMDAVCRGFHEIVILLLNRGADANTQNNENNDYTPLMYAISNNRNEIAAILIKSGKCAVNRRDKNGKTALMMAASKGNIEATQELLKILKKDGGDLNLQDEKGYTALMYAILNNRKDIVELLIDNGADLKQTDKNGRSPMKLSKYLGYSNITKILKQEKKKSCCG
jgi:ankyrin repeat protein